MKNLFQVCWVGLALLITACGEQERVPTGQLFVMTRPEGAVVEVNHAVIGTTPLQDSRIPAGPVLLKVRKEGFEAEYRSFTLTTGQREVQEINLRPVTGLMLIRSDPPGAAVSLGAVSAGITPLALHQLPRGSHRARLMLAGFDDKEVEFTVTDRTPQVLDVQMNSNAGTLVIHSEPTGAAVFVDGRNQGLTPLSLNQIGQGRRDITLQLAGYEPYRRQVEVEPARTARVEARLKPLPGGLRVVSLPPGGRVYLNGEFQGEAPVNLPELEPGAYSVRVDLRGHATESRNVRIGLGERVIEEFQLVRNSGTLQIITRPAGVKVNVDGEFVGTTQPGLDRSDVVSAPLQVDMLSQGSHTLQLVREGYTFETKRFFITQDQVTTLEETLERKFIPNVLVRIGTARDEVLTGVLVRRHPNGDLELEIARGVFRTLTAGSYLSVEPLRQEEELEDSTRNPRP